MRRPLPSLLLVSLLVASAVAARAASGDGDVRRSQYRLPEPAVTASTALGLPPAGRCVKRSAIRVALRPPAGVTFASVRVQADATAVLRLTGLAGPGSVLVPLPRQQASRVRASGTTSGGQVVSSARTYRRCPPVTRPEAKPRRRPGKRPLPYVEGGGEG